MDTTTTLGLLGRLPVAGAGPILTVIKNNHSKQSMSIEESSACHVSCNDDDDDGDLELGLGLGLGIGGGLKVKEEASGTLGSLDFVHLKASTCSCESSSSSTSVDIAASSIVGTKRAAIHSVSADTTSVVGWPPISKAHRVPIMANRLKSEHEEFSSAPITKAQHLSVKVNMDGTPIGRKVDLLAHTSYQTLAQTLDNMFYGRYCSELLNGTSEFVLTYEDKDGDCMLVGDVPWQIFLSSVKRLRILRTPKMQH